MKKYVIFTMTLGLQIWNPLQADSVGTTYVMTGVFDGAAPVSVWSSPNTSFYLSFTVPEPVTPTVFNADQWDIQQPITYSLGGSFVGLFPSSEVQEAFWVSPAGGLGVALGFGTSNILRIDFGGPQMFTGSTDSPILLLPQSFAPTVQGWVYYADPLTILGTGSTTNGFVTTVPEPSTGILLLAGSYFLGRRIRKPSRAGWRGGRAGGVA